MAWVTCSYGGLGSATTASVGRGGLLVPDVAGGEGAGDSAVGGW